METRFLKPGLRALGAGHGGGGALAHVEDVGEDVDEVLVDLALGPVLGNEVRVQELGQGLAWLVAASDVSVLGLAVGDRGVVPAALCRLTHLPQPSLQVQKAALEEGGKGRGRGRGCG
eukprot:474750-Rhodomonas_salina.6